MLLKVKNDAYRQIHSNSNWFNNVEYFDITDDGYCLIIAKCYMEVKKRSKKFTASRHFTITSEMPLGRFAFEQEESTEDEIVIYYNNQ